MAWFVIKISRIFWSFRAAYWGFGEALFYIYFINYVCASTSWNGSTFLFNFYSFILFFLIHIVLYQYYSISFINKFYSVVAAWIA